MHDETVGGRAHRTEDGQEPAQPGPARPGGRGGAPPRAAQAAERLAAGPSWAGAGLVFTTPIGTAIDPNNFRRHLARVGSKAGLGAWTTHELRHSAGSLLFAMGVPMKVISETLVHSSEARAAPTPRPGVPMPADAIAPKRRRR